MKHLTVAIISAMITFSHAVTLSWMTVLPLMLMGGPAEGFFGLFRRRPVPKSPVLKEAPEGPVRFPPPNFSPQGVSNFFNPMGSNSFFPSFQNTPSFNPFRYQANRFNPMQGVRQPWSSPTQNMPVQSQTQFPQEIEQNFNSEGQNFGSEGQNFGSEGQKFGSEEQNFGSDDQSFESGQDFDRNVRFDDQPPAINTEEAESFFTLLAETDENKCISRLVCEMGADPNTSGDLGQTVNEIIGSLTDFPPGSKVSEYNEILRKGRSDGLSSCMSEYSTCDEETYHIMKSNQPEGEVPEVPLN